MQKLHINIIVQGMDRESGIFSNKLGFHTHSMSELSADLC